MEKMNDYSRYILKGRKVEDDVFGNCYIKRILDMRKGYECMINKMSVCLMSEKRYRDDINCCKMD